MISPSQFPVKGFVELSYLERVQIFVGINFRKFCWFRENWYRRKWRNYCSLIDPICSIKTNKNVFLQNSRENKYSGKFLPLKHFNKKNKTIPSESWIIESTICLFVFLNNIFEHNIFAEMLHRKYHQNYPNFVHGWFRGMFSWRLL